MTNFSGNKLFRQLGVFCAVLLMTITAGWAQTSGLIYKPATGNGANILDPNGDGYISETTSGFSFNDTEESEIQYIPLYQTGAEATRDVRTGPPGKHTDLVGQRGDGKKTAFLYYDATNDALLFRVRLAGQSKASKGYSFLFNTDFDQFGPKADNFSRTNPGFQYEVVLETNFGISIYDWSSGSANKVWSSPNLDDYFQKAISYEHYGQNGSSGEDGYFYDFYIPLDNSGIPADFDTQLRESFRVTVSTITNAQRGIEGVISDILGSDDLTLQSECIGGIISLACYEVDPTTITPDINIPLYDGDTSISGRLQEEDGSTVYVYKDDSQIGTATVTDFEWELTGITLAEGDVIKVRASTTGKNISDFTSDVTVVTEGVEVLTCTDIPTSVNQTGNGSNNVLNGSVDNLPSGISFSDLTIRGYLSDGSIFFSTDASENTTTVSYNSSSFPSFELGNGGASNLYRDTDDFFVTAQLTGECESDFSNRVNPSGAQTQTPTITSSDVTTSTTVIEGIHPSSNADIYLYNENQGEQIGFLSSDIHTGTWSIDVSSVTLEVGDQVFARAVEGSNHMSQQSNKVVVGNNQEPPEPDQSETPEIIGDYIAGSNVTVEGFSAEEAGSKIKLYINGTIEDSTEVLIDNTWQLAVASLSDGDVLTATATAPQETESAPSAGVTVLAGTSSVPSVDDNLTIYSTEITGSSNARGTLKIYVDDGIIGEKELAGSGTWIFDDADAAQGSGYVQNELYQGATVTATLTEDGKPESNQSSGVDVAGITSFSIEASGGGDIDTQVAGTPFDVDIAAKEGVDGSGNTFTAFVDNVLIYSIEAPIADGFRVTENFTSGTITHPTLFDDGAEDVVLRALYTNNPEITGASNPFLVNNPEDVTLTTITPDQKYAGEAEFELSLTGTNFVSSSVVRVNGSDRTTNFVSSTKLKATILESDISSSGTLDITVVSPPPQGTGGETDPITLTVQDPPAPTLTLGGVTPNSGEQFSTFDVTLTGTNLIGNGVTDVNLGSGITVNSTTSNEDYTELTATITIDGSAEGTRDVAATNPAPNGGTATLTDAFTVNASDYTQFIIETISSPQTAGTPFEITIRAANSSGVTYTGFTGQVDLSFSDGGIEPVTTGNFTDGEWTDDVMVTKAGSDFTISAINADGTGNQTGTSNTFNVDESTDSQYLVSVDNESPEAGADVTVTAQLADEFGNPIATSGKTVTWSSTNDGSFDSGTSSTNSEGLATVIFTTSSTEGTDHKISASDGDGNTGQSSTFTTTDAPPTKIVFKTDEKATTAGASTDLIIIELQDDGDVARAATSDLTISLSTSSGTGVFRNQNNSGDLTNNEITIAAGVSSVSFRYRDNTAGNYTIEAANDKLTNDSQGITITTGSLAGFNWSLNSPQTNGEAFTGTNTLTAVDQYNNTIEGFDASTNNVTISTSLNGTISGLGSGGNHVLDQAADFTDGVAGLSSDLSYTGEAGTGTFTATSSGSETGTSENITINPGSATQILVETANDGSGSVVSEQTVTPGNPITAYAISRDQSGNFVGLVTDATWSLTTKTGGVADGDLEDNEDGSATFTGNLVGSAVINASSGVLTETSSGTITIEPGDASKLAITTQPVGGSSGELFTTQPVIKIQDAAGNTVTDDNSTDVSVAIQSGAGGSLSGTTTVTASNGVITFTDLGLTGTADEDYILRFNATDLTEADSNPVNITAGAPAFFTVSDPDPVNQGDSLWVDITGLQDSEGNTVANGDHNLVVGDQLTGSELTLTDVTFENGEALDVLVLDSAATSKLTAQSYENISFTIENGSDNADVTIQQTLNDGNGITLTVADVAINQGEALSVTIQDINDLAGNSFSGTVDIVISSLDDLEGYSDGDKIFTGETITNGEVTLEVLTSTETSGLSVQNSIVLTASIGDASGDFNVSVNGVISASNSSVAVNSESVLANGVSYSVVKITVRDESDNPVTGLQKSDFDLAFETEAASSENFGSFNEAGDNSDPANGIYTFRITNESVETGDVQVTVNSQLLDDQPKVAFTQPIVDGGNSFISASPAEVVANGTDVTTLTITVADANGVGIEGFVVGDFTFTGLSDAQVDGETFESTENRGEYTVDVTNTTAEDVTVNAEVSGEAIGSTGAISFIPGPAASVVLTGDTDDLASGSNRTLTATIYDGWNNIVTTGDDTDLEITFSKNAGTGTVSGLSSETAIAGVSDISLEAVLAGSITIRASAQTTAGTDIEDNLTFNITPGDADRLAVIQEPEEVTSGEIFPESERPVIQLRDAAGNDVAEDNVEITASLTHGNGTLSGDIAVSTAANGQAEFTNLAITGTAGSNYILNFDVTDLNDVNTNEFTVNTGLGTPTIATPADGDFVNIASADELTVSGTASEAESVRITISDSGAGEIEETVAVSDENYTSNFDVSGLDEGALDIEVVGIDAGNNESDPASVTVTLDLTAPVVSVDDQLASINTPTVTGTSDQPEGSEILITVNGETYNGTTDANGGWSIDIIDELADNEYTVSVSTSDEAGNETSVTGGLEIDTTPPALTINDKTTNDTTPTLTGTSDENDGTVSVAINEETYTGTVTDGDWEVVVTDPLPEGDFTAEATISDEAGNTTDEQAIVTIDITSPAVVIQNAPATVNSIDSFTVTFEFDEDVSGFSIADIEVGNGSVSNFSSAGNRTYTADITPDGNGNLAINVAEAVAVDAAGNDNEAATQVEVAFDNAAPNITIEDLLTSDTTPTLTGTSDEIGGMVTVSIDGSDYTATVDGAGNWEAEVTISLGDGVYTATASITDGAGNEGADAAIITIDTSAPSGYIAAWDTDPINSVNEASAGFTIADGEDGAGFDWSISDGTDQITGSGTFDGTEVSINGQDISSLADGTLTLTVTLTDDAGNEGGETTIDVEKDTETPQLTSIQRYTPADELTNADELIFTTTFNEDVSGVSASDFGVAALTGSTISVDSVNSTKYEVTVNGGDLEDYNGSVALSLADNPDIKDTFGNDLTNTTVVVETYTLDNTAPEVTAISLIGDPGDNAASVEYEVTFSENTRGFNLDGFGLTTTGNATGNIDSFNGSDDTYTVTVNQIDGVGSIQLDFHHEDDSAIEDLAGNPTETDFEGDGHAVESIGDIDVANSSVDAVPTTLQAGQNSTITIVLKDENDNAISGKAESDFTFDISGSDAELVSESFSSEGGEYEVQLTNEKAEEVTVTVVVDEDGMDTEVGDATITFTTDVAANIALSAVPVEPVAGENTTFTATVTDQYGNVVENEDVDFALLSGNGNFDGVFENIITDESGQAVASYTTHSLVETADVQVELSDNKTVSDNLEITSVPGAAAQYLVSVSNDNPDAGEDITVTAQLADANENSVAEENRTVNWSSTNGGSFSNGAISQTDANGETTVVFTVSSTADTSHVLTAMDGEDGTISGDSETISTGIGEASQLTFDSQPNATTPAGSNVGTITVRLEDASGNLIEDDNTSITIGISNGATLVGTKTKSTTNGIATFDDLYIQEPGTNYTLSATSDGLIPNQSNSFDITRRSITVTADAQSITYGDGDPELSYQITEGFLIPDIDLSGGLDRESGEDAGTYAITQNDLNNVNNPSYNITFEPADLTVNPRDLILTNFVADDKAYDGTTDVAGDNFDDDRLNGDDIEFTYDVAFTDANTGTDKDVNFTNIQISGGADADNYVLKTASGTATADITNSAITGISWPEASDITYGQMLGNADLSGGSADQSGSFAFTDETIVPSSAGSYSAEVIFTPDDENYSPNTADIDVEVQPKGLTVSGAEAEDKEYDGTDEASIIGATLQGVINDDDVNLDSVGGIFAATDVNEDIEVTPVLSLSGADSENYLLTQPTNLTADITVKELTIDGSFTAQNKVYDGSADATISEDDLTLAMPVNGDEVILNNVVVIFETPEVGDGIEVSITSAELSGSDSGNYVLSLSGAPTTTANIAPGAISEALSSVTATPKTLVADGNAVSTLTIELKDENAHEIHGKASDITLSGLQNATSGAVSETNRKGIYEVELTNTVAEEITVTVTADGTDLDDQPEITFVPGDVSASQSSVTATSPHEADGADKSTIIIELKDGNDNLITGLVDSDFDIMLTGDGSAGSVTETDTKGVYETAITNSTAENISVTIIADGTTLDDQPNIVFEAGSVSAMVISGGDGQSNTVTSTLNETLEVLITDENDNPVSGQTVSFAITEEPDDASGSSLDQKSSTTDANGLAAVFLTLGDKTGSYKVTASSGSLDDVTFTLKATPGDVDVEEVTITADPSTLPANESSTSKVSIQLKDTYGNLVTAGAGTVELSTTLGSIGSVTDNDDGTYSATFTSENTLGTAVITGKLEDNDIEDSATIELVAGAASVVMSTITASDDKLIADGESSTTVTVQLKDESGNNITAGGDHVTLNIDAGSLDSITDKGDGTYTTRLTASTSLDTATISGAVNGNTIVDDAAVEFVAGPAENLIMMSGNEQIGPAGKAISDSLRIKVTDAFDNPVENELIEFSLADKPSGANGASVSANQKTTDTDGMTAIQLTLGDQVGAYTVEAGNGSLEAVTFTAEAVADFVDSITKISGDDQTQATLSILNDSLVVQLKDEFGNPVPDHSVNYAIVDRPKDAEGAELFSEISETDNEGYAYSNFKLGSVSGDYIISAIAENHSDTVLFTATGEESRPDPTIIDTVNTVVFTGSDDSYMYTEPSPSLDELENMSVEIWMYPNSLGDSYTIMKKTSDSESDNQFRIRGANNTVTVEFFTDQDETVTLESENFFVEDTESDATETGFNKSSESNQDSQTTYNWTHLAVTFDSENGKALFFRNGFKIDESTFGGTLNSGNERLTMGSGFDGEIHEVRVWNSSRSRNELQSHLTRILTGNEENLVLYHTFDDDNAEVDNDLTDKNNHLFLGDNVDRNFSIRGIPNIEMLEDEDYIMAFKGVDEDGDELDAIIKTLPKNGRLYQIENDGESIGEEITTGPTILTDSENRAYYKPDAYYFGEDKLEYALEDIYGNQAEAVREITIYPVNNRPKVDFADNSHFTFNQRDTLKVDLTQIVDDVDNAFNELSWSATVLNQGSHNKVDVPAQRKGKGPITSTDKELNATIDKHKQSKYEYKLQQNKENRKQASKASKGSIIKMATVVQSQTESGQQDSLVIEIDTQNHQAFFTTTPTFYAEDIPVRFEARDPEGEVDSDTLLVTVNFVNDAPAPFEQLLPAQNDTVKFSDVQKAVKFTWEQTTDIEQDSIEYIFELTREDGHTKTVKSLVDTSFTIDRNDSIIEMDKSYSWQVWATDKTDTTASFEKKTFIAAKNIPMHYRLSQNYPNPFNPTTKIEYWIPIDSKVKIQLYNILGQQIAVLKEGEVERGLHALDLNASELNLASGVYLYRMAAEGISKKLRFVKTRKFTFVK